MLRQLIAILCVTASTLAAARERHPAADLTVTPATPAARLLQAPQPLQSEAQLRIEDATRQAQNNLFSALENAQHLGSKYRTWLWVTPSLGQVNGASIRVDFP